jgi:C4-dicarboxylate-specific signal transduction histidine kinase
MNEVVREVLHLVRARIADAGVAVHLELAPELPQVRSDRIELEQVLLNLVGNAVDALQLVPGGRALTVRTKAAPGGGVQVVVEDTGPGIPADEAKQLFLPFHSTKPGGLGMGLAICRTILAALGGRIWAEPAAGRGARFRFVVPPSPEQTP